MADELYLTKSASINKIDSERVQIRFPDHNHVTLECDAALLQRIFDQKEGLSADNWIDLICCNGVPADAAEPFLQGLMSAGVINRERLSVNDWFDSLLAREDVNTAVVKQGEIDNFDLTRIGVYGNCPLADIARRGLGGLPGGVYTEDAPDFAIVVQDNDNMSKLSQRWSDAPAAKFKTAFWFDGGALRLGPGHIPGETACIDCFLARTEAASQFTDEARTYRHTGAEPLYSLPLGQSVADLSRYILTRTVRLARGGQFNILKPGHLETWSVLSGTSSRVAVLRNPFCSTCSDYDAPLRAIRDMT
ncbi:hypothetical protein [Phaeobacter sp.]|uniref:hypothetical protein n=1 Tax=Phaeobacter sp. TaxID=1902409 RepID=UPI0025D2F10D|nr:hypothetical protein [Phaeobacter sp.]